jgi:hypothetical protein
MKLLKALFLSLTLTVLSVYAQGPSFTIDTTAVTAVTATSQIKLTNDKSITISGTTCNTTAASLALSPFVTARTAGTSFTIELVGTTTTNGYTITN